MRNLYLLQVSTNACDSEPKKKKKKTNLSCVAAGALKVENAAHRFSDALLTLVNTHVSTAYETEREIETELRIIERLLSSNNTLTEQWTSLLNRLTRELKEMGHVANWLEALHKTTAKIHNTTLPPS